MKLTYEEFILGPEYFKKEPSLDGIELKAESDMTINYDYEQIKGYYTRLYEMGFVDRVAEDVYPSHTTLTIVMEVSDGSQYHRRYTKWYNTKE